VEEIKLKRLALFLLESIFLQGEPTIDEGFTSQFNEFIEKYYQEKKELFHLMYDQELLEEFLKNNWEILPFDKMIELLKKYHGFAGYAKLVDEVGREVDEKLIELANLFAEYHFFLLDLYCADPAQYYSRGYSKVLNLIIN
jgi:hypothetical protein